LSSRNNDNIDNEQNNCRIDDRHGKDNPIKSNSTPIIASATTSISEEKCNSAYILAGFVDGNRTQFLLDSAASRTFVDRNVLTSAAKILPYSGNIITAANGQRVNVVGETCVKISLCNQETTWKVLVIDTLMQPVIVGQDLLRYWNVTIDFANGTVCVGKMKVQLGQQLRQDAPVRICLLETITIPTHSDVSDDLQQHALFDSVLKPEKLQELDIADTLSDLNSSRDDVSLPLNLTDYEIQANTTKVFDTTHEQEKLERSSQTADFIVDQRLDHQPASFIGNISCFDRDQKQILTLTRRKPVSNLDAFYDEHESYDPEVRWEEMATPPFLFGKLSNGQHLVDQLLDKRKVKRKRDRVSRQINEDCRLFSLNDVSIL
jgi:predicted aspartyl protease